ncbi:MAG TPA: sigma-70 family RNA polymerase sigma factor [Gemmataceae bacterium]|nr:sigma-70 family RNA polymerase sigma factor [Gemmataceae bacterium]
MMSSTTLAALVAHCRKLTRRQQTPDAELLRRFVGQREATAFEELLERYASLVWGVCRRIVRNETDCEDAFQAVFLALFRQAHLIQPHRPLGAWLHGVAVRAAFKAASAPTQKHLLAEVPEQGTAGDVADELGNRELFRVIDEEIARLPALLHAPFVLCCLEGRTRDEAAAVLGCSVAAIKSRLERSRCILRRRLERRGFGLPAAFLVLGLTGSHVHASLRAKALQSVLGCAPPAVAALVPTATMGLASKLTLAAMSLVMVGVLGFGAFHVMQAEPPQETPPVAEDEAPRDSLSPVAEKSSQPLDRFGDPLPKGAIRRFGTLRFRYQNMFHIAFTPDGKQLIAGDGCSPLAVFDALSGRKLREVGEYSLGANALTGFALSPDGKQVACCGSEVFVWDLETGRLVRQLHCGLCGEVIFSPDGTKLAAAVKETTRAAITGIVLVEAATGKHLAEWTVIKKEEVGKLAFGGIAFSPDGKFLAGCFKELREEKPFVTGFASSQVWLLDSATGKRVRTFGSPDVPVTCSNFQPGTGRLATFGKDGILRFWDVATGKEVQHFPAAKQKEGDNFGPLQFSADGSRCALLTDGAKYLTVLDTKDGRVIRRIEGKQDRMRTAIALSADGKAIASARLYHEPCVRVWDVASGAERLAEAGHRAPPTALSLSPDGRTLISRDQQGREIHWDLLTGKSVIRSTVARENVGDFIWSPDYSQKTFRGPRWRVIYKNQRPAMMEVWTLNGAKLIRKVEAHGRMVPTIALSPDGRMMAIAAYNANDSKSAIMLWDPDREEKPRRLPGAPEGVSQLFFTHDGKKLIGGGGWVNVHFSKGGIWLWDVASGRIDHKLPINTAPGRMLLTGDDRVLLIGDLEKDATVYAWDIGTGKEIARMTDPSLNPPGDDLNWRTQPGILGLALSADERFLAVVSSWRYVSAVSIWETGSWKLVRAFAPVAPRNHVKTMVFSRDGRSLLTANGDSTILEWDVSGRGANSRRPQDGEVPNVDRLNDLWRMLAETPDKAYPAVWEMLDHPTQCIPFLREKLTPIQSIEEKRVRQLLAHLDSDSFEEREKASQQVLALGEQFLPILRQTLNDRPTPEIKKRLERILESLSRGPSPEKQRLLRALAALEWSDRREAGEHLRRLAGGAPSAYLTQAAKTAWQRFQEKSLGRSPSPTSRGSHPQP